MRVPQYVSGVGVGEGLWSVFRYGRSGECGGVWVGTCVWCGVVGGCMWSMCVCWGVGVGGVCVELVVMKQVNQFAGMSTAVVVNVVVMMCGSCGECGGDDVWQLR